MNLLHHVIITAFVTNIYSIRATTYSADNFLFFELHTYLFLSFAFNRMIINIYLLLYRVCLNLNAAALWPKSPAKNSIKTPSNAGTLDLSQDSLGRRITGLTSSLGLSIWRSKNEMGEEGLVDMEELEWDGKRGFGRCQRAQDTAVQSSPWLASSCPNLWLSSLSSRDRTWSFFQGKFAILSFNNYFLYEKT